MRIRAGKLKLDDFCYSMRMMPTIDTLSARIGNALIADADINLLRQTISVHGFAGDRLDVRYITPDSAAVAAGGPYPTAGPEVSDSLASAPSPLPARMRFMLPQARKPNRDLTFLILM